MKFVSKIIKNYFINIYIHKTFKKKFDTFWPKIIGTLNISKIFNKSNKIFTCATKALRI